ncbi:Aste57867_10394 [Aphanomyces stellatus]|uniref:Aste57867_10394 protein n=1 Tax=Aphanomyces stellatus TaxID=120398 RepID=A0A485KR70_9STRA|nr:hypothetical protein As57867_010354 [Aphanomyces stellatus]VFT87268.1 Aste57867_10394 [Aphanomyces stellatus]
MSPSDSSSESQENTTRAPESNKKTGRTKQHDVPKFLLQLFDILEAESSAVIKWADDGASLQILDPVRATQEILPKYFSHNNFQSFQRQLNYFGFRKWTKTKTYICTFSHPFFRKNEPDKLQFIKRKSVPKRTRINGHLVSEMCPVPVYIKKKGDEGTALPCPIRPYGSQTIRPHMPLEGTGMKVMPADVILFPKPSPNLSKIRSSLMLRLEAAGSTPVKISPTSLTKCAEEHSPTDKASKYVNLEKTENNAVPIRHNFPIDTEDPVNLLLGIKQAVGPSSPKKEEASLQSKLDEAFEEISRLKACLQYQMNENERLRSHQARTLGP